MKDVPSWLKVLLGLAITAAVAVGVYLLAANWEALQPATTTAAAPTEKPAADDEDIAYWTCVMHPTVRSPEPGTCPVCSMELTPQKKGAGLTLTKRQKELIPVRTEPAGYHALSREIRTVGTLTYNERTVAIASTRVSGWIERLYVDFAGTRVRVYYACPDHPDKHYARPGRCPIDSKPLERHADHLVEIYSPELMVAQREYLAALEGRERLKGGVSDLMRSFEQGLVTAGEAKLRLLGLTDGQIEAIRQRGEVVTTLTLFAPMGGTVIEAKALLGQHVKAGAALFKVADLAELWMLADIYEYELPWVRRGMPVEITGDAFPGRTVRGEVAFIYPYLHTETRTVKVLVEVPNADGGLSPGMAVTARLRISLADIHAHEHGPLPAYACPMHPWITSEAPGHCSICGMALEPTRPAGAPPTTRPVVMRAVLTCGMPGHPVFDPDQAPAEGTCPVCGMVLVKKQVPALATQPATKTVLTCGMPGHPVFTPGDAPASGKCPVCGMVLVEKQVAAAPAAREHEVPAAPDALRLRFKYVCPNHPGDVYEAPGRCPKDDTPLVNTGEVLAVPKLAVLDTGERTVVYVDLGDAGYAAREVTLGPTAWTYDDAGRRLRRYVPVLTGVQPGEQVVTRGSFLIDSQSQITGAAAQAYGGQIGGADEQPAPRHQH